MHSTSEYEVRVSVKSLEEAAEIIKMLDGAGYREVELGPPRGQALPSVAARIAGRIRGHFNNMILRALRRLEALDREHGVELESVVNEMATDPELRGMQIFTRGRLTRIVAMVTNAILVDKRGWVDCDRERTPRRFWLTKKGIERLEGSGKIG